MGDRVRFLVFRIKRIRIQVSAKQTAPRTSSNHHTSHQVKRIECLIGSQSFIRSSCFRCQVRSSNHESKAAIIVVKWNDHTGWTMNALWFA